MIHVCIYLLFALCGYLCFAFDSTTEYTTTEDYSNLVPGEPQNLTVVDVYPHSLKLKWSEPDKVNGVIKGYRVFFTALNYTEVNSFTVDEEENNTVIKYDLKHLKPLTEYSIYVKAYTGNYEGNSTSLIKDVTDIGGPSAPTLINVTCIPENAIYLEWQEPDRFYKNVDYYFVYIILNDHLWDNFSLSAADSMLSYLVQNVTTNSKYGVQLQAGTKSRRTNRVIQGEKSKLVYVHMRPNCEKYEEEPYHITNDISMGVLVGIICAIIVFLLALIVFLLWRKCFQKTYYFLNEKPCCAPNDSLDWNETNEERNEESSEYKGAIPEQEFRAHVAALHADGDIGFSKEYECLQAETAAGEYDSEHSQHPENKAKNRYLNIIAYDHTRVHLLPIPGENLGLDYINANYIDGYQWSNAFIGTQGPLPSTFDCFWRMVWEQRVSVIIMITNLVERGRRKCDMYWPKEGFETFGVIQVQLLKEDITATYTVRKFQINHLRVKKKRSSPKTDKIVFQYHYTNWPDHGTPDHPLPVLNFVKKSSATNPPDAGPVIVHCSAGVGRTGTYIVLDAMLRQIRSRHEVNVYGFLRHIRSQRNFLVQTEEQYIFIHDALVEAIESGDSNFPPEEIMRYAAVSHHSSGDITSELWDSLERQYKLVTSFQVKDFHLLGAHKAINLPKNRPSSLLPIEVSRVHLTPKPGEEGSEYINATWVQGFFSLREYIITPHPMTHTVIDFWQMAWDHNAHVIVNLTDLDGDEYPIFWPVEGHPIGTECFRIRLASEKEEPDHIYRGFVMQSLQDDYEIPVRMFHQKNWPHCLASIEEIYDLTNAVLDAGLISGPTIVVDRYGSTDAATFALITSSKKHLVYEKHADIYMYAKLYHNKRPGIWRSISDYHRLYQFVGTICETFEEGTPPEAEPGPSTSNASAMPNGTASGSISSDSIRVAPEAIGSSRNHISQA